MPTLTLSTTLLHGRPFVFWHKFLCLHEGLVPCSRYGRNSNECAWWAIAAEAVYVEANGDDNCPFEALDFYMGLAVNDSDGLAELVYDYWYAVPACLKRMLGTKAEVRRLAA